MPKLIAIYEYRWYTVESAPDPDGQNVVAVSDADEKLLRARELSLQEIFNGYAWIGVRSSSYVIRQRKLQNARWEKYGPTDTRTVCRKVNIK